ncbi:hypothetical protein SOVF_198070 [Spinacia oleracea]|uniref:Protein S40-3-like n=1 Tax=Spinacia oleracea TaxID=3562 RepID=A0A9R0JG60_SPIOL|nr:protein S40-3-like [Spinacia oleracea]KNA04612.1 hypothetical protein SOVF_198070 [Spinacia oleracea]
MDFEDFEESEVMFSDYSSSDESVESSDETESDDLRRKHYSQSKHPRMMLNSFNSYKLKQPIRISSSMPVNIPPLMSSLQYGIDPFDDDDDEDDPMRRLPPHLIVEKRDNEEMARSFSPLKGKHLCEARNSILRMTGFLER